MNWNKRLTEARIAQGLGKSELAREIGVSAATLTNWENGKVESIKGENLMKVCVALNCSESWLMRGSDSPPSDRILQVLPGAQRVVARDDNSSEFVQVAKVKLRLSAGITGFQTAPDTTDGRTVSLPRQWLDKKAYSPDRLVAIKIKGESMEPALHEDDVVIVNTAETEPRDGYVFAVNYEGEAVVKRLSRDAGDWWLTSDNSDQRKFHRKICRGPDCIIVGRVVRKESDNI